VIVHTNGTNINAVNNQQMVIEWPANGIRDFMDAIGFVNVSGNEVSDGGSLLTIQKNVGEMLKFGANYGTLDSQIKNPHIITLATINTNAGGNFQYRMQDGTSSSLTLTDVISNIKDDGTAYPGSTFANGRWGVSRVFSFTSNALKIQPTQDDYKDKNKAIESINNDPFVIEPSIQANGMLIGYIINKGDATDLTNPNQAEFLNAGKFGAGVSSVVGGTQDMQSVYDQSLQPQILTDDSLGAVQFKRGTTGGDTDSVFEIINGSSTQSLKVTGAGEVTIGTTGTEYKLPTARGTLDQTLVTDASGVVTWQTSASGGVPTHIASGTGDVKIDGNTPSAVGQVLRTTVSGASAEASWSLPDWVHTVNTGTPSLSASNLLGTDEMLVNDVGTGMRKITVNDVLSKGNVELPRDPTPNDNRNNGGFEVGQVWINTIDETVWKMTEQHQGGALDGELAFWRQLTNPESVADARQLTNPESVADALTGCLEITNDAGQYTQTLLTNSNRSVLWGIGLENCNVVSNPITREVFLAVSDRTNDLIDIYKRDGEANSFSFLQTLKPSVFVAPAGIEYGNTLSLSSTASGVFLYVGARDNPSADDRLYIYKLNTSPQYEVQTFNQKIRLLV